MASRRARPVTWLATAFLAVAATIAAGCGASENAPGAAPGSATSTTPIDRPQSEAAVVCDGRETRVTTARVRAQPDGAHVRVENTTGARLPWLAEARAAGDGAGMGSDAPPGVSNHVLPFPPGRVAVACHGESGDPSDVPRVAIEVVDPDGVWTDTSLGECAQVSAIADYVAGARGRPGTPVEVARALLTERDALGPDDRVERAGYRAADAPALVRLVRAERTVAVLSLIGDGNGGWLLSQTDACSGEGLD
jgi:hypothetical protein